MQCTWKLWPPSWKLNLSFRLHYASLCSFASSHFLRFCCLPRQLTESISQVNTTAFVEGGPFITGSLLDALPHFPPPPQFQCCFSVLCTCEILSVARDLSLVFRDDSATLKSGGGGDRGEHVCKCVVFVYLQNTFRQQYPKCLIFSSFANPGVWAININLGGAGGKRTT